MNGTRFCLVKRKRVLCPSRGENVFNYIRCFTDFFVVSGESSST